jgi:hypothetical protein
MIRIEYISYVALAVSALSLLFTVLTYRRNSAGQQLKLRQNELMRVVSSQAIILWDEYKTIWNAGQAGLADDNFVYSHFQETAKRLESAIDQAIRNGLADELITKSPKALLMHTLFSQALYHVAAIPKNIIFDSLKNKNLIYGIDRILQRCQAYDKDGIASWIPKLPCADQPKISWTYLESDSVVSN